MCGIAGIINTHRQADAEEAVAVRKMLQLQRHRGPDADGFRQSGPTTIGHRRLAIIDLSPDGIHPMANEDGTVWVILNGEIYNYLELRAELMAAGHRFHSRSDTEVIVHAYEEWGIRKTLERLRGMFAF